MNALRVEVFLLLACARVYIDARQATQIEDCISKNVDWPYLLRLARSHQVMPLVYGTLNSRCPNAVPIVILEELREHFYANAGRNLFLAKELLRVLQIFNAHGISSVPYKGPVLATLVYGNLALRQFGDLDILVEEQKYQTAQKLLATEGYELKKEFEYESTFVHESGIVAVDLHRAMTAPDFACPLNFEYLSGRVQSIRIADTAVPTLSPEDTLLMLAIQITKDAGSRYFQLAKICDVAELLRVYPKLHLLQGLREAKKLGCERMLLYTLRLANDLLGAPLPETILYKIRYHPAMDTLAEYSRQQLFDSNQCSIDDQPTIDQFRSLIRERLRDKIHPYYIRYVTDVLTPCELDRCLLPLPQKLSFLYYFIRPVRLLTKHALPVTQNKRSR